jgi:trimethylamine:corrinoid methyltransferase-like protein
MSKIMDVQSAADKAAIMAVGAFMGARWLGAAGTLSLDEIFSPEQLLLDCEIRDWVERAIRGVDLGEDDVEDWLAETRAGIQRGFMGLDGTLNDYRLSKTGPQGGQVWYPRRFTRNAIGAWRAAGEPRLQDRLRDEVRQRIAGYTYELTDSRRDEIERIYRAAETHV